MSELEVIRKQIHEKNQTIVQWTLDGWIAIAEVEPWLSLPPNLDQNHLPQLLDNLSNAALRSEVGKKDRHALLWSAVEHGRQRRESGFGENLLYTEYHLLRRTLWSYLRDTFSQHDAAVEAILRIDAAITLACSGSLLGYHHKALEAAGTWPEGVEKILDEWSLRKT
jgi:hypothetical protein